MAVPSRKNKIMQNQERDKEKLKGEIKQKEINEEEHKERLEILKKIGLIN